MSNNPLRMFQPNADPSVQYDFARIDLAKKKEFIEKAFAVQRNHIEQMPNHWIQELFLYTLEKGYRNYRENMIADFNDQKLNLIEFKKLFSKFFTYNDFEEITQRYFTDAELVFLDDVSDWSHFF